MERENERLRERLLGQVVPPPGRLEAYSLEVKEMIGEKEKALRWERRITTAMWLFLVALCTVFLLLSGLGGGEIGLWFGIQACFWLLFGAVFLLRYFLNRNRLEFLKEIKGLELRLAQLAERLDAK